MSSKLFHMEGGPWNGKWARLLLAEGYTMVFSVGVFRGRYRLHSGKKIVWEAV